MTSKVDYEVSQHNNGKAQDATAFLLQPRLLPRQATIGAKSLALPLERQLDTSSTSSDDFLLPASAWQPENQKGCGTVISHDAPPQRSKGLARALTFRKGKGDASRSLERKEKRSLEEIRTNEVLRAEDSKEHTSVNDKLKKFSLRSKPKDAPTQGENDSLSTAPSKTSRAKGSLTSFFGVSESAGHAPPSPREPPRSKPPSISSLSSRNGSVPSLGEPAVYIPPAESSRGSGGGAARKKDELANVIKTLEGDYSKYENTAPFDKIKR